MMEKEKAGFGIRFLAYLVDSLIVGFLSMILGFLLALIAGEPSGGIDPVTGEVTADSTFGLSFLLTLLLGIVYFVWIPKRTNGQTLGKKLTKIRIVKTNHEPLTIWTLFLREFIGKFLSSIILFIGFLMILGKNKRGLHDYIAKTYVIRED